MVKLKDGREVYGIIYKIHNVKNNKIYFGQTTRYNGFNGRYACKGIGIERVYKHHLKMKGDRNHCNQYLLNSIEKYGFDSFIVDEVFDVAFSEEELNRLEYLYIATYLTNDRKYGYNFREGGGNAKVSEDSVMRNGTEVYCINNGKIYKSMTEAGKKLGLPQHYVKSRIVKSIRKIDKEIILSNQEYYFFKLKRPFKKGEGICCCCGNYYMRTKYKDKYGKSKFNTTQKYCKRCVNDVNLRKTKKRVSKNRKLIKSRE